jgi:DNA-binding beta-propeller fold protein YncE
MGRPYALLRIGFSYEMTLGMRRLTNTPVSLVIDSERHLHILCRGEGNTFVRRLTMDDEDMGAYNLVGGGGQVGGSFRVKGQFTWPSFLTMDSDENLWLSDEGTNKISVLSREGEVLGQWGETGEGKGQLNRPACMAFDPEGNIYVSDTMNHRVQKFTKDGKFLLKWGRCGDGQGEFNMPWGITVDELGDVYVVDWHNDRVQKFNADGDFLFEFGRPGCGEGEFNRPSGVTVDGDGDTYVSDWGNHRVQLFDSEGRFVEQFIGDATLSRQAKNYMITNMKALRLREMTSIEPQKRLRWPVSVTVDEDGRMYAADYGSHRIQVYKKDAMPLGPDEIVPPLRSPSLYTQF